jgi:hypothetical protein
MERLEKVSWASRPSLFSGTKTTGETPRDTGFSKRSVRVLSFEFFAAKHSRSLASSPTTDREGSATTQETSFAFLAIGRICRWGRIPSAAASPRNNAIATEKSSDSVLVSPFEFSSRFPFSHDPRRHTL